jgi:hypothetical protein
VSGIDTFTGIDGRDGNKGFFEFEVCSEETAPLELSVSMHSMQGPHKTSHESF